MKKSNVVPIGNHTNINIKDDEVTIQNLKLKDPQLAEHLSGYEDQAAEVVNLISSGLQVANYTQTSANMEKLEIVGDAVKEGFKTVGEQSLQNMKDLLASHTDAKNVDSLAHKLIEITSNEFIKVFDPTQPSSPLNRSFARLDQLLLALERNAGMKEVSDKTSRKGTAFNLVISEIVQSIATGHCDFSAFVDAKKSEKGAKVGDELVTLNPDSTGGAEVSFVFEYKTEEDISQSAALRELLEAMDNRGAKSGVFVAAKNAKTEKWREYSFHPGNRMIIVVDKDNPDENLILFSYIWARWMASRDLVTDEKKFDYEKMSHLLTQAMDHMRFISEVRKSLTQIATHRDDAVGWVNKLDDKLKSTLGEAIQMVTDKPVRSKGKKGAA